jgi:hypothetical protein
MPTMQTLQYQVVLKTEDGFEPLEVMKLVVTPRLGEHITLTFADGKAHAYEVIAVMHPDKPATTAAEIIVKYIDTDLNFRLSL